MIGNPPIIFQKLCRKVSFYSHVWDEIAIKRASKNERELKVINHSKKINELLQLIKKGPTVYRVSYLRMNRRYKGSRKKNL